VLFHVGLFRLGPRAGFLQPLLKRLEAVALGSFGHRSGVPIEVGRKLGGAAAGVNALRRDAAALQASEKERFYVARKIERCLPDASGHRIPHALHIQPSG
jgi:hypothetical protein